MTSMCQEVLVDRPWGFSIADLRAEMMVRGLSARLGGGGPEGYCLREVAEGSGRTRPCWLRDSRKRFLVTFFAKRLLSDCFSNGCCWFFVRAPMPEEQE